jgi:hypothetical protein
MSAQAIARPLIEEPLGPGAPRRKRLLRRLRGEQIARGGGGAARSDSLAQTVEGSIRSCAHECVGGRKRGLAEVFFLPVFWALRLLAAGRVNPIT